MITSDPTHHDIRRVLDTLRDLPAEPAAAWDALEPADWPAFFRLIDLGADLPRLAPNQTLGAWTADLWPELTEVREALLRLQDLVDRPIVPAGAEMVASHGPDALDAAIAELEDTHCTHLDFLLEPEDRRRLDGEIEALAARKPYSWGELAREEGPGVWEIFERALGSERFGRLTGFDLERDEFSLTLSLQSLDAAGIGWHRDLYWPREWVGEDVFAVLYALGSDTPERGGAFVYYVPWRNAIYASYRQQHHATVMWNSAAAEGRLIHAVSGYLGPETSRHLVILQCHRRADARE